MKIMFIFLASLIICNTSFAFDLPDGYRYPNKSDLKDEWKNLKEPYKINADFNNDGLVDEAWILPKIDNSGFGLFIFMQVKNSNHDIKQYTFKLEEAFISPYLFSLDIAEPSEQIWETSCGKGYYECGLNEQANFKITKPSLMLCAIESTCSIYMWENERGFFNKINLSD